MPHNQAPQPAFNDHESTLDDIAGQDLAHAFSEQDRRPQRKPTGLRINTSLTEAVIVLPAFRVPGEFYIDTIR